MIMTRWLWQDNYDQMIDQWECRNLGAWQMRGFDKRGDQHTDSVTKGGEFESCSMQLKRNEFSRLEKCFRVAN